MTNPDFARDSPLRRSGPFREVSSEKRLDIVTMPGIVAMTVSAEHLDQWATFSI
jgi:hypothetical protein